MSKMNFCLLDKKGELYKAGEVRIRDGVLSSVTHPFEILRKMNTHEMSGFKILDKEQ